MLPSRGVEVVSAADRKPTSPSLQISIRLFKTFTVSRISFIAMSDSFCLAMVNSFRWNRAGPAPGPMQTPFPAARTRSPDLAHALLFCQPPMNRRDDSDEHRWDGRTRPRNTLVDPRANQRLP